MAVTVRILILTDDDGSYDPAHRFSLTELVSILRAPLSLTFDCHVTTAHRAHGTPYSSGADVQSYDFTKHFDPNEYDEIWFFGVSNEAPDTGERFPLSAAELEVVCAFMDSGGGVFATGDHESLGKDLCGQIPRVRTMRRWEFDYSQVSGPQGYDHYNETSGDGPPVMGPHRHDTLVMGHDLAYQFDDQSDDIPQTITPRMYMGGISGLVDWRYPHPLLCGPQGVIDILPDHMHEGECQEPDDLTGTFPIGGTNHPEYPAKNGWQVSPQVIAWGTVDSGKVTAIDRKDTFAGPFDTTPYDQTPFTGHPATYSDYFGSIGAYDGHLVDVGRVAVDSTFHHFFNVNLNGAGSHSSDPVKQKGFTASAAGEDAFSKIKQYYWNIAQWLAPATVQQQMFTTLLLVSRRDGQLRMSLRADQIMRLPYRDFLRFGAITRSAFARITPACAHVTWVVAAIDPLALLLAPWVYVKIHMPDPPPDPLREVMAVDPQEMVTAACAGVMVEVLRRFPDSTGLDDPRAQEAMEGVVGAGVRLGLERAIEGAGERLAASQRFLDRLKEATAER